MKKILFVLCFFSNIQLSGQNIKGKVTSEDNKASAFVNVILLSPYDSTVVLYGAITDLKGNYVLKNIKKGKYIISASKIGYETIKKSIDYKDKELIQNIVIKPTSKFIDVVNVEANSVNKSVDKTIYNITPLEKKKAASSFNLLETIPKLNIDNIQKKVSVIGGGNVKILINGLNAEERDLLALKPSNVVRVEYYDMPPARYANSNIGAVVNIITKKSVEGGTLTTNFQNAFLTGFGDDLLNFKYNKKNSQINIMYYLSYRNYKKRVVDDLLEYSFKNENYTKERIGIKSPMSYTLNIINLEFINQKENNYTFQIKFAPGFLRSDQTNKQNVFFTQNTNHFNRFNISIDNYDLFQPALDIYFSKQLKNNQKIIFNVVGTYFDNKYSNKRLETSQLNDTTLYNLLKTNSNKYSVISEAIYSKKYDKLNINYGLKYTKAYSTQNIINTLENGNTSSNLYESYGYIEAIGKYKKLSYSMSIGLSYNTFKENELNDNFKFLTIRPIIRLNYPILENSTVKLTYINEPEIPSLSQLSRSKYFIDENLVYSGNPNLKPYKSNNCNLEYSYNKPRFNASTKISYSYANNPILTQYMEDFNYILQMNNNQEWNKNYFISSDVVIYPFKSKWLRINLYGKLYKIENKIMNFDKISFNGNMYTCSISANYKKWTFKYQSQSSYKELYSQTIWKNAAYSSTFIQYKNKNLTTSLGMLYPFSKSWNSKDETVKNTLVNKKSNVDIFDNGHMIVINLSYNFSFGRNFTKVTKSIYNSDNDAGILKVE